MTLASENLKLSFHVQVPSKPCITLKKGLKRPFYFGLMLSHFKPRVILLRIRFFVWVSIDPYSFVISCATKKWYSRELRLVWSRKMFYQTKQVSFLHRNELARMHLKFLESFQSVDTIFHHTVWQCCRKTSWPHLLVLRAFAQLPHVFWQWWYSFQNSKKADASDRQESKTNWVECLECSRACHLYIK